MTIRVLYSCELCGLEKVGANVPARTSENVIEWFEKTLGPALSADHAKRSPGCAPENLKNVMVPMTGATKVGGAPEN